MSASEHGIGSELFDYLEQASRDARLAAPELGSRGIGSGDHDIALAAYEAKKRLREREEQWRRKRGLPSLDHPTPKAPARREATGESFPQELWDLAWEDYRCSKSLKERLHKYVAAVKRGSQQNRLGLFLGGHSLGAGKRAAAVLVAKDLAQSGIAIHYITFDCLLGRDREKDAIRDELESLEGVYCDNPTRLREHVQHTRAAKERYESLTEQEARMRRAEFVVIDGIKPWWTEPQRALIEDKFVNFQRGRRRNCQWTISVSNMAADEVWDYYPSLWAEFGPDQLYIEVSPDDASKHAIQAVLRNDAATPA
jgi:hypothetical protein